MNRADDNTQDSTAGDNAPTTVANPRRTRVGADGRPTPVERG